MIYFVRGLPGSGKSTTAKKIAESYTNTYHLEADMFWGDSYNFDVDFLDIAHQWCQMETARHLFNGDHVIVSNTFVNRKEFLPYLRLAVRFSHNIDMTCCHGNYGSVHNVPDHAIDRMKRKWEYIDLKMLVDIYEHIKYGELF